MLERIHVRNFAIVDQVELRFNSGLSTITGETGAGKSILLDALNLALGDRADPLSVRHGCDKAEIEAEFAINDLPHVQQWLKDQDLDDDSYCLLRRVISSEGRSRGYINGRSVPNGQLQELGEQLVDIHGQHEHQSLTKKKQQLKLLDAYGVHPGNLKKVADTYRAWQDIRHRLDQLHTETQGEPQDLDYLRFQIQELQGLNLAPGEYEQLDEELHKATHAGDLVQGTQELADRLYNDDQGLHGQLAFCIQRLQGLLRVDESLGDTLNSLEEALIQLQEAGQHLGHYADRVELDAERLQYLEQRISTAQNLARKHHCSPNNLPEVLEQLSTRLDDLTHHGERVAELTKALDQAKHAYLNEARLLSDERSGVASKLNDVVSQFMNELGMPGGTFECRVTFNAEQLSASGSDDIQFLVSANPGQPLQALSKVASGGELARISLAIQVATTEAAKIPTLIFDEVDTGIGGAVAEMVGQKLRTLGQRQQVVCVTHLAQVASHAHHHFKVEKQIEASQTHTTLYGLNESQRVEEIARMLGGAELTESTLNHASEMVNKAQSA